MSVKRKRLDNNYDTDEKETISQEIWEKSNFLFFQNLSEIWSTPTSIQLKIIFVLLIVCLMLLLFLPSFPHFYFLVIEFLIFSYFWMNRENQFKNEPNDDSDRNSFQCPTYYSNNFSVCSTFLFFRDIISKRFFMKIKIKIFNSIKSNKTVSIDDFMSFENNFEFQMKTKWSFWIIFIHFWRFLLFDFLFSISAFSSKTTLIWMKKAQFVHQTKIIHLKEKHFSKIKGQKTHFMKNTKIQVKML